MWIIHFTAKETQTNRLLEGDSTKCDYQPNAEQAIQECKDIVEYFNSTLRPGEKPREFVKVDQVMPYVEPSKYGMDEEDEYNDDDDY